MGITAIKLVSQKLLINKTSLNTLLLCIAKLRLVGFFYLRNIFNLPMVRIQTVNIEVNSKLGLEEYHYWVMECLDSGSGTLTSVHETEGS